MHGILKTITCLWVLVFTLGSSGTTCEEVMFDTTDLYTRLFYSPTIGNNVMKSALATRGSRRGDFRAHYNSKQLHPEVAWRFSVAGLNLNQIRESVALLFDLDDRSSDTDSTEVHRNLLSYFAGIAPSNQWERGQMLKRIVEDLLDREMPGWRDQNVWTFEAQRDVPLFSARGLWPKWYKAGTLVVVKDQLVIGTIEPYRAPKLNLLSGLN